MLRHFHWTPVLWTNELGLLRGELCTDAKTYCRECFTLSPWRAVQNPPNVFRVGNNLSAKVFFIFDKPNNNDRFRESDLIPISVFDPRPAFGDQRTHRNLLNLLGQFGLDSAGGSADPLDSGMVHITNSVKCDKCAVTGATGQIPISGDQATRCVSRFLMREIAIIKPVALVFFGVEPQRHVLGRTTPSGELVQAGVGGTTYWVTRVPHPSPQSFNTHGRKGEYYKKPFRELMARIASTDADPADRATQDNRAAAPGAMSVPLGPSPQPQPFVNMESISPRRDGSDVPYGSRMYRTGQPYFGSGKREHIWNCWSDGCTVQEFVKLARRWQGGPEDVRI